MKKLFRYWLMILLWLSVMPTAVAANLEINLPEAVELSTGYYRLGDIATIKPAGDPLAAKISELIIGQSPRPNFIARIPQRSIAARLESEYPQLRSRIEWSGEKAVKIKTRGVMLESRKLIRTAREFLVEGLAQRYSDYEISPVGKTRDILLAPGQVTIKPRGSLDKSVGKRFCVWLDIYVNGEFSQTRPVWFEVSIMSSVLVATQSFQRGDSLRPAGLEKRRVDITLAGGESIRRLETIGDMRLRQPLAEGEILTMEMLQQRPEVSRGQRVTVSVSIGTVALNTQAIALSDGRLKQKILVKSPESGEDYSVIVTGPALTRVD